MAIRQMTLEEFLDFLKRQQGEQSDRQFAQSLGISPQYLCDVYNGRREPGDKIASALNAERSTVYTVTTTKSEEKK